MCNPRSCRPGPSSKLLRYWSPRSPCAPCSRCLSPHPPWWLPHRRGDPVWLLGSFAALSLLYRTQAPTGATRAPAGADDSSAGAEPSKRERARQAYAALVATGQPVTGVRLAQAADISASYGRACWPTFYADPTFSTGEHKGQPTAEHGGQADWADWSGPPHVLLGRLRSYEHAQATSPRPGMAAKPAGRRKDPQVPHRCSHLSDQHPRGGRHHLPARGTGWLLQGEPGAGVCRYLHARRPTRGWGGLETPWTTKQLLDQPPWRTRPRIRPCRRWWLSLGAVLPALVVAVLMIIAGVVGLAASDAWYG
jgi:hypothetical protein